MIVALPGLFSYIFLMRVKMIYIKLRSHYGRLDQDQVDADKIYVAAM